MSEEPKFCKDCKDFHFQSGNGYWSWPSACRPSEFKRFVAGLVCANPSCMRNDVASAESAAIAPELMRLKNEYEALRKPRAWWRFWQ